MAKLSGPEEQEARRVAKDRVVITRPNNGVALFIAINQDWTPNDAEDYPGGVPQDSRFVQMAERALTIALEDEINPVLSLRAWIERERDKRGGGRSALPRLAADLLGMPDIPKRQPKTATKDQSPEWKRHAAELRKLEEYAQGKYSRPSKVRQDRFANLPGAEAGNPFRPLPPVAQALRPWMITFGARADWLISDTAQPFTLKRSTPELVRGPIKVALEEGGAGPEGLLDALIVSLDNAIGVMPLIAHPDHEGHVYSMSLQARKVTR